MPTADERRDWNQKVIDEFRANKGAVGGQFGGMSLLLLTHTGARTGAARTSPLAYLSDGERLLVFASNGGRDDHPAWYHNVIAHPTVTVEVGPEKYQATAVVTSGEERDALFARQAAKNSGFAAYQAGTSRLIPVVALERAD